MKREILDRLLADRAAKRPVALVTHMESGEQALVYENALVGHLEESAVAAARAALERDRSALLQDGQLFVRAFSPPLRMIIVGAVHITQALAPMARLAGYEVIVIDPRQAWTRAHRFPDVQVNEAWPDQALTELQPDARTAIVTLSHDPKLDDPALHIALRSKAFYIGCLGSPRTHAARLERLRESGFGDAELARIHGPIGLDIGAKSPAEIAIAVLAQLTQVMRR